GGVIVFLPNILILFLFISLMEDTGYMARAVFIMDKLMHKIGLHGKSFIPMVMGFGCNVPAVMATRTLGNRNDRLLTMLINPFMSCSARLPVYILIIGAFFPDNAGTMLFSMYFIGVVLAIIMALVFKKLLFNTSYTPFVMELPPFRVPTLKTSLKHMWYKGSQYLKKMGGVILVASIIIWALGYYPREATFSQNYDAQIEQTLDENKIAEINLLKENERFEQSYIGRMGQFVEPVIKPLGFDWKMGVSLLTGFAAKEIVVSTMGVLYQADASADETSGVLMNKLKNHRLTRGPRKGEIAYTPLVALSFMLFVLIYFPCVSTIAAINTESGGKRWAVLSMVYPTILAWVLSFAVFQIGTLLL
ncbi:MAG: ferrous iron transport protein B, partial [Cyclobacteriaceae bacterium]|nr:ferrous iron transport protein B [Cyclobacteriaceae bacterium]